MSFWNDRRVFVTGATGFLGYALTDELLDRGADVVALVRDRVPRAPFFSERVAERVATVNGSVEDYDLLERAINEHEIDTVFHLAAQAIVGVANRDPLGTFEANIKGTWCLLEACRRNDRVTRVVAASSDKAYGSHDVLPYSEDCALQGKHPYDVSKSCADLICATYHNTWRTPVCVTRCGNLFGPGDLNYSRIVPGTIRSVLRGERPIIRSDGTPMRDYVHVRDIANAYILLAEKMEDPAVHGRAYNFGTGEPMSVLDLTRRLLAACGREDLEPDVLNEGKGEILHQYLSSDRARDELGWRPGASVGERLDETVAWYREHLAEETGAAV
ncbi:MAG: NAD-dependent epimerase/dehydratase family protein [Planctomycetota bacterium]